MAQHFGCHIVNVTLRRYVTCSIVQTNRCVDASICFGYQLKSWSQQHQTFWILWILLSLQTKKIFFCLNLLKVGSDLLIKSIYTLAIITRRECLLLYASLKIIHAKIISFIRMRNERHFQYLPSFREKDPLF